MAKKGKAAKADRPLKLTWTQMWLDLVLARIERNKTERKCNAYLLELWQ